MPNVRTVIVARGGDDRPAGAIALESLIGPATSWRDLPDTAAPDVAIDPEDLCTLFYTSGTTGAPKGAYGTHRNVITNLLNMMVNTARQFLRRGETPPAPDPAGPKKASLLAIPLFHVTGCHAVLVPSVAQGAKIVMMHRWDALRGIELIEKEKINGFGGVPAIAWQVIEHPRLKEFDTSSVETVSYGGAPSSAELVRKIVETFPKVSPGQGYGLTETSAAVTNIGSEDYEHRPLSCGPAHPINDVRVVDSAGNGCINGNAVPSDARDNAVKAQVERFPLFGAGRIGGTRDDMVHANKVNPGGISGAADNYLIADLESGGILHGETARADRNIAIRDLTGRVADLFDPCRSADFD